MQSKFLARVTESYLVDGWCNLCGVEENLEIRHRKVAHSDAPTRGQHLRKRGRSKPDFTRPESRSPSSCLQVVGMSGMARRGW